MTETHNRAIAVPRDELDRLRLELDAAEGLATLRSQSLTELQEMAQELWFRLSYFTAVPVERLGTFIGHITELADTLVRTSDGYADARASDMAYLEVLSDLEHHGWAAVPDAELDRMVSNEAAARGYRRGWQRGPQLLLLWFSGPSAIAHAQSSDVGRLFETREVRAVVTSPSNAPISRAEIDRRRPWASSLTFDATYRDVDRHLIARGWTRSPSYRCAMTGVRRSSGKHSAHVWKHPTEPDLKVFAWRVGSALRVAYWAGAIVSMSHLARLTDRG